MWTSSLLITFVVGATLPFVYGKGFSGDGLYCKFAKVPVEPECPKTGPCDFTDLKNLRIYCRGLKDFSLCGSKLVGMVSKQENGNKILVSQPQTPLMEIANIFQKTKELDRDGLVKTVNNGGEYWYEVPRSFYSDFEPGTYTLEAELVLRSGKTIVKLDQSFKIE